MYWNMKDEQKVKRKQKFHKSFPTVIFLTGEIPPSDWATSKMGSLTSRSTGTLKEQKKKTREEQEINSDWPR